MNRGVAGSQAYAVKFGQHHTPTASDSDQLTWLGRGLDQALIRFIESAGPGDTLRGAFYEFHYDPVLEALAAARDRGVDLRIVFDAKQNGYTDKQGKQHPAFPRGTNISSIGRSHLTADCVKREANASYISHNKFLVLVRGGNPVAVWTGSTNLSMGAMFGQANVGHLVHDRDVAQAYLEYWDELVGDPDAKVLRKWVDQKSPLPNLPLSDGISTIFSPRTGDPVLPWYTQLMEDAQAPIFLTAAFGVNADFAKYLEEDKDFLRYVLLESRPRAGAAVTLKMLGKDPDTWIAVGSRLTDVTSLSRFQIEQLTGLNDHVDYLHTKFLVIDPLGDHPVVVTGSANFSEPSNTNNDENMLVIRGDSRVSDIYLTEFNRLFQHFYFRWISSEEAAKTAGQNDPSFLTEDESWTAPYYDPTSHKGRERLYFK